MDPTWTLHGLDMHPTWTRHTEVYVAIAIWLYTYITIFRVADGVSRGKLGGAGVRKDPHANFLYFFQSGRVGYFVASPHANFLQFFQSGRVDIRIINHYGM